VDKLTGEVLGTYRLLEVIGQGGMATVYKAVDESNDSMVAVKLLSAYIAQEPRFKARFAREVEVLRSLSGGKIVPILGYGEQDAFTRYVPGARIFAASQSNRYVIANLAKGGVVKVFTQEPAGLLLNDAGLIGRTEDGRVVSSQWIGPDYECKVDEAGWEVTGHLHVIAATKLFTPVKNLVFRTVLVALGWSPRFSHLLKAKIRKVLILRQQTVPVRFRRRLKLDGEGLTLVDELHIEGPVRFTALSTGDDFSVRYVPQSRYFQAQELASGGTPLAPGALEQLNRQRTITIEARLPRAANTGRTVLGP